VVVRPPTSRLSLDERPRGDERRPLSRSANTRSCIEGAGYPYTDVARTGDKSVYFDRLIRAD
jgi:hypothetical protein